MIWGWASSVQAVLTCKTLGFKDLTLLRYSFTKRGPTRQDLRPPTVEKLGRKLVFGRHLLILSNSYLSYFDRQENKAFGPL